MRLDDLAHALSQDGSNENIGVNNQSFTLDANSNPPRLANAEGYEATGAYFVFRFFSRAA